MKNSYKRFITPLYVINIVIQAIISLLSPIAIMFLLAWLLDKYTEIGSFIYVVFILLGVFSGLYSMVLFVIRSGRALEALEKQNSSPKGDEAKK